MRETWTDKKIAHRIALFCEAAGLDRMPTSSELVAADEGALCSAISANGGWDHFSAITGLPNGANDVRVGWAWEGWVAEQARLRGCDVVARDRLHDEYDLVINGAKVDVKYATGAIVANGIQWSWRIAREEHVCDFYALVGSIFRNPPKLFIYPASKASLTMITGRNTHRSHVAAYLNAWHLLRAAA